MSRLVFFLFTAGASGDLGNFHPHFFDPFLSQLPGGEGNDTGIHIQLGKDPGPAVLDLFAQMGEEISPVIWYPHWIHGIIIIIPFVNVKFPPFLRRNRNFIGKRIIKRD